MEISAANYKAPIITMYDFLRVPAIGTLSLIKPYRILTLHGIWIMLMYKVMVPGFKCRYYLYRS